MAGVNRRGRDWVLGGRQLAGVFVLLVVLFGMVFTLGYLLGRNQYDAQLRAAASIVPGAPDSASDKPVKASRGPAVAPAKAEKPTTPDWDFYHSAEPAKPEPIGEPPKSLAPSRTLTPGAGSPVSGIDSARSNIKSLNRPSIPRGAIVLQVAAMAHRSDAVGLAQALQQKKFPAFVLPPGATTPAYAKTAHAGGPGTDRYYRVQVGPYTDAPSADLARQKLESQGFKAIARR